MNDKVRLDQYLWAIRIFKTRALAKQAIDDGKVRFKLEPTKPSKVVHEGDVYQIRTSDKRQSIQVRSIINKRVAYTLAVECYFDVSTPEEQAFAKARIASSFYTGKRLSNVGRPTKKQARELNDFTNEWHAIEEQLNFNTELDDTEEDNEYGWTDDTEIDSKGKSEDDKE